MNSTELTSNRSVEKLCKIWKRPRTPVEPLPPTRDPRPLAPARLEITLRLIGQRGPKLV
jgi:hypothetical protein